MFQSFSPSETQLLCLSAGGAISGHVGDDEADDSDDDATSAEQSTQQVSAQQPEQPSQPAFKPSLQRVHRSMPLLPHPPSEQPLPRSPDTSVLQLLQRLPHQPLDLLPVSEEESSRQPLSAESSVHLTSSCIHLPVMESSCSNGSQQLRTLGMLMPESPGLLPKSGFFSIQQPPDK